ncbi:MAG: hypothetical protein SO434_04340 [Eubacteriales bacterium]|nr:hypothetical protein [Eubacteriales bacterium]
MKVKILDNLNYQTFPIVDGMVEIDENTLHQIGITLQFKGTDGRVETYEKPKFTANYDELVNSKIRTKYTLSQELAILRQKEEKIDEYKAYYDYCEACKAEAKTEIGG